MTPQHLARALRSGILVSDHAFDVHLPAPYQALSGLYWTPVEIAAKAAWWLTELGARTVLDVGAGVGKFCVIAALARDLEITGIEQRGELVRHAEELARRFAVVGHARFIAGELDAIDPDAFDAIYAFNPFGENLFTPAKRIDSTVDLTPERFHRDVRLFEKTLERLSVRRMLVTYHGFGGRIPDSFECVREARLGSDVLRIWRKIRSSARGREWIEVDGTPALVDAARDRAD